jgi:hypothetical protein
MCFDQLNFVKIFLTIPLHWNQNLIIWDYVLQPDKSKQFLWALYYGMWDINSFTNSNGDVMMNNFSLTGIDETKINNYICEQGKNSKIIKER